ncbi:hypothetical protein HYT23_06075 [Candidatus Pacearchaeota archaeon]|nr:hypothetical protein [Candidatus Pacearchaeota archaeon]
MRISREKKEKISEQILANLFLLSPQAPFLTRIAKEIARDEEFVKTLLKDLKSKGLVFEIKKNPHGVSYIKRSRWKLSDAAYVFYKQKQEK